MLVHKSSSCALASSNWEKTNHKSNGEEIEIWLKENEKRKEKLDLL